MSRKRSSRFLVLLALALITGLALAGCARQSQPGALAVGDPAPDFTLSAADGGSVSLAEYRGVRPVLLYFHMAMG